MPSRRQFLSLLGSFSFLSFLPFLPVKSTPAVADKSWDKLKASLNIKSTHELKIDGHELLFLSLNCNQSELETAARDLRDWIEYKNIDLGNNDIIYINNTRRLG